MSSHETVSVEVSRRDVWKLAPSVRRVALGDEFQPPMPSVRLRCIHCGEECDSRDMVYRWSDEEQFGRWCCPTPGCDGKGVGLDLWECENPGCGESGGGVGGPPGATS